LEIGSVIPNVEWKSKEGNSVTSLHQINAEEIVLIFWSSDCPHCDEAMKKADEWAIIK
jgi:thiol-disulfide isomerase/thioredoxin